MKRIAICLTVLITALTAVGCSSSGPKGQVIGVDDRPTWDNINPYGMSYIPSGDFHAGPSDQDMNDALVQRSKRKSIQGFYMDETEITNNEYRQFVYFVRDSIAHHHLDHYMEDDFGEQKLDWEMDIDWASDSEDATVLNEQMYYKGDDQYWGQRQLDPSKLVYERQWYKWQDAARQSTADKARNSYIQSEKVEIYPDTLVWVRDFSYSYNEPMTRNYFWHPAFDEYPVVGVDWNQANAFCNWRTHIWNDFRQENGGTMSEDFRLPFEDEWEYAARGGLEQAPYPWGGPYTRNSQGCLLANFKPGRGNYPEDGGFYTVRADAYHPNDYGLYNMAGNVSEWTSTAYFENAVTFGHDMNTDIRYDADEADKPTMRRKVIRGGSWKDIAYYIQTGSRHWEYQDSAKSYIGFRSAITFLGRSANDKY